jgi:hypothetical protein
MPRRTAGGGRPAERPPRGIRAGRPPSPPHNHRPEPGQVPAIFVSTASDERREIRGHLDTLRFSLSPSALRHPDTNHPARSRPTSDRVPTNPKAFGASPQSGLTSNPPPACYPEPRPSPGAIDPAAIRSQPPSKAETCCCSGPRPSESARRPCAILTQPNRPETGTPAAKSPFQNHPQKPTHRMHLRC